MTNTEFAEVLEKLAAHYRADDSLKQLLLFGSLNTKEELRHMLKSLGGKWTKRGMDDVGEYVNLRFISKELDPLLLTLPRNKVCRKIVTFECDPIMSPEEEAEILEGAA